MRRPTSVPVTRTRSVPETTDTRTRSAKSRAVGSRDSRTASPRSSASDGALTRLTSSSTVPASAPISTASVRKRVSRSAIRPRYSISTRSIEVPGAIATASWPSLRHSGTNGPSSSWSSAEMAGMLTAVDTTPPVSAATTCSAVCTPARSWASAVEAPRCGVTTTCG